MSDLKQSIAAKLSETFATGGFVDTNVDRLRQAAGVSLRTLYRSYPSRYAMIVGAMDSRHATYLDWLREESADGVDGVLLLLKRSGLWLERLDGKGCLFLNALSANPDNAEIKAAVIAHKAQLLTLISQRLATFVATEEVKSLSLQLFTLLEGQNFAVLTQDVGDVTAHAMAAAQTLLVDAKRL